MYANGLGVAKDEAEAYKWHPIAKAQGAGDARESIDSMEKELTAEQRAQGWKLADDWKPAKKGVAEK